MDLCVNLVIIIEYLVIIIEFILHTNEVLGTIK